jgi:multidrug efflux pump subunit AcrB
VGETVETKLARLEEKLDNIIKRLETGDDRFREFEKRIQALETKAAIGAVIVIVVYAVSLQYVRAMIGG